MSRNDFQFVILILILVPSIFLMTAIIPIGFNGRLFFRLDVLVWYDSRTMILTPYRRRRYIQLFTQLRPLSR